MLGYLSADMSCAEKLTTVSYEEQIMSKDKHPSMFSPQMEANCVYYPSNLYGNARLFTEVEVNRGGYLPSREAQF